MFNWADEEPVQDGGDAPHAVWRCRDCWARNHLAMVGTALPYLAKRGDVRSEWCGLCSDRADQAGEEPVKSAWDLILIGGVVELDPHGGGQGPTEEGEAHP